MIFFVGNDGTIVKSAPSPVYQGAANANTIYLVAPFAANLTAAVAFQLPNGVAVAPAVMTPQNEIEGVINEETGKPYAGWSYSMPNTITEHFGTVLAQFYFYAAENGVVTASSTTSFQVARGVPAVNPTEPGADEWDSILSILSSLQTQLNNGYYAARAIYAWNAAFTYGANEITFYKDAGAFGSFVKSLKENNTTPPYNTSGVLNASDWEVVVDFDTISESYFQSIREQVDRAETAANTAQEAAEDLSSYAERAVIFVEQLPEIGNEEYLYAVISDAGSNLFELWVWDDGEWKSLGGANLVSSGVITRIVTLLASSWQNNAQTVGIDGLTANKRVVISPADLDAAAYVLANITATTAEGEVRFSCGTVPEQNITVYITVRTEAEVPNLAGYYTEPEVDALAGHSLSVSIDNETYILTLKLIAVDGTELSSGSVDLPLESVVIGGEYDAETKSIVLTLQSGQTIDVPVGDLIDGLASQSALDAVVNGTTPVAKAAEADSAATAEKVANTLTITKGGEPYKEYDGSEAVNIDISAESPSMKTQLTLATANWLDNRQDVPLDGVTATNNVSVYPVDASAAAYILSDIMVAQAEGKLIFTCATVPAAALSVVVEIS